MKEWDSQDRICGDGEKWTNLGCFRVWPIQVRVKRFKKCKDEVWFLFGQRSYYLLRWEN